MTTAPPTETIAPGPAAPATRGAGAGAVLDRWLAIAAGGCLATAAIRLVPFQTPFPLSAMEAEARWAGALAIACLALALRRRSRRTALALALSLVVLVPWSLEWLPVMLGHDGTRTADLTILTANVLAPRPTPALARELRGSDADVILVEEASDEWWALLEAEGVLARYPHHVQETHSFREDYMGIAILSRLPIVRSGIERLGGTFVPYAWVDVHVHDATVRLYAIHTLPPFAPSMLELHLAQTGHLRRLAERDLADPSLDVVVLAGDLNASPMSRQYRRLRETGLVSAHERVGRGFATTWPNLPWPIPPMRLDHVLVGGRDVEIVSVREGLGEGSDHQPVYVSLSLPRTAR